MAALCPVGGSSTIANPTRHSESTGIMITQADPWLHVESDSVSQPYPPLIMGLAIPTIHHTCLSLHALPKVKPEIFEN